MDEDSEEFYDARDHDSEPPVLFAGEQTVQLEGERHSISATRTVLRPQAEGFPVQTHRKSVKEFEGLTLVQEIQAVSGERATVWVMKFSPSGSYLALAGQQPTIITYEVSEEPADDSVIPLLCSGSYRSYVGHDKAVVDLSWDIRSAHFASASMDKSVLLWRLTSSFHIAKFPHPDIVSAVSFAPTSSRFLLTSCFDRMIRIWNVEQGSVVACLQTADLVTALAVAQDGSMVAAGMLRGSCIFYQCTQDMKLKFLSQLNCRNRKGLKSKGRKVTGIEFSPENCCLVTTNDSRVRLMDLQEFVMRQKYKGAKNEEAPIRASFSHNFSHVIMGSDGAQVYIWNVQAPPSQCKFARSSNRNSSYEVFAPCRKPGYKTTCAVFAPDKVRQRLQSRYVACGQEVIVGHVVLAAGTDGVLRVFYNNYVNS